MHTFSRNTEEYGAPAIDYQYDALNQLVGINTSNDPANKWVFTYANNDKPATVTSFTGDATNFVSRITYGYDADERVQTITSQIMGVTATTSYTYDANGNVYQIVYPSATTVNYNYNNLNQPTSVWINGNSYI